MPKNYDEKLYDDIVGNETSKVYSKSVFLKDDDEYIEKVLDNIMEGEEDA